MKREFKLDFSGMLGIFVAGVVFGILGTVLFSAVRDVPTSNPHSIFRDRTAAWVAYPAGMGISILSVHGTDFVSGRCEGICRGVR